MPMVRCNAMSWIEEVGRLRVLVTRRDLVRYFGSPTSRYNEYIF